MKKINNQQRIKIMAVILFNTFSRNCVYIGTMLASIEEECPDAGFWEVRNVLREMIKNNIIGEYPKTDHYQLTGEGNDYFFRMICKGIEHELQMGNTNSE